MLVEEFSEKYIALILLSDWSVRRTDQLQEEITLSPQPHEEKWMFNFANLLKKGVKQEREQWNFFSSLMVIVQTKFKIKVPKF